jgi:alkanesulfonate monooxygenase
LRAADAPEKLRSPVERVRQLGLEVCLRLCILARPTRQEAIRVAESMLPQSDIPKTQRRIAEKDDSQMYLEAQSPGDSSNWLTRSLWTGFVPYYGPVWMTLLGTPAEIADALLEYKALGVTQFIISGWPELDTVVAFGRDVLPLVREREREGMSR